MVQIHLLGGVSAHDDEETPLDVGPAKCQAVLAVLALAPGSSVPVSRLVELVWGEDPPRTAAKTLQSYVARLRKGLGSESIVRTGAAYRLDVSPDAVDVARFQRHLEAGRIEAALAEWGGTPLAGLDTGALTATVDGLVERWLTAVESDLARRVDTDPSAVIGSLTELTASHPFREGLWALLMTALYRVGRQADALAAFRTARRHLVDELGVEPGQRLRDVETAILGHEERLGVGPTSPQASGSAQRIPSGTVTFGFTDLAVISATRTADGAEIAAAMTRQEDAVRAAANRHGGHVFAVGGDSFGVAFHRASDAAHWATDVHSTIAGRPPTHDVGVPADVGGVGVSIGLHTGETEERGGRYFGPAVIIAGRLAAAGHGAQTIVSAATSNLLGVATDRELGVFRLEGVAGEQRILQLDDGAHPPLRIEQNRRTNLPHRMDRLVGRDDDLAAIRDALAANPIVTLVGPGGIGKTRLALAAAHISSREVAAEVWLIELAGVGTSSEVAAAVADVAGVDERPGRTPIQSIVATMRSRRALLVLDNCEHVVAGAAELAEALAEHCPHVRVLATSREGLGVRDEQLIAVAPLDPDGAGAELFRERAAAVSQALDPDPSGSDVEEICRRLDGIPLAIELAAARTRTLSPADLVARLDDGLRLLTGGRRTSLERHRTLRATIQWSYDLLTPAEQELFQRLSIFAGPFDLRGAERVAGGPIDELAKPDGEGKGEGDDEEPDRVERVGDGRADRNRPPVRLDDVDGLLGDLVDRSMVAVESGPFGRRFRLLETMSQFAAEHLSAGRMERLAERHARWSLAAVTEIGRLLAGPDEAEGVVRLRELRPNLRAAFDWACATQNCTLARDLVSPIAPEVYLRSQNEIADWAERILAMTPPDDEEMRIFGLTWAARRHMRTLDHEALARLVDRYGDSDDPMIRYAQAFVTYDLDGLAEWAPLVVAELRKRGDERLVDLFDVAGFGLMLLMNRRLPELDEHLTPLVERFRADGPPTCLHWALALLGLSASLQGEPARAWRCFDESASVVVPDRTNTLRHPLEARAALRSGRRAEAFELLHSYVDELLDQDNLYLARFAAVEFAEMMARVDRTDEAAPVLDYIRTSRVLDLLDAPTLQRDAVAAQGAIARSEQPIHEPASNLDDRGALRYMLAVLDDLRDDPMADDLHGGRRGDPVLDEAKVDDGRRH